MSHGEVKQAPHVRFAPGALQVLGSGGALPGAAVSNTELLDWLARSFGVNARKGLLIAKRLGIETRHVARAFAASLEPPRPGMRNPELAHAAMASALAQAKVPAHDLQYLITHTATPAQPLPPNGAEVAERLNFRGPIAELRQACCGFANALQLAAGLLRDPGAAPVGIVGSEVGSVFFDPNTLAHVPEQWVNMMQMGDGAAAVVIGPAPPAGAADADSNDLATSRIESAFYGLLHPRPSPGLSLQSGGSDWPGLAQSPNALFPAKTASPVHSFGHDFAAVRTHGANLFLAGLAAVEARGHRLQDFRWVVPHQVSGRIGAQVALALGLEESRVFVNAHRVGNLGSAAMWLALHQLRSQGHMQAGERALFLGAEATHYAYGGFVYCHGSS